MPVDTVWHWYWALLGNSKTTLHILRGPKNEKGKQLGALIEAGGHFRIRVAEIAGLQQPGCATDWAIPLQFIGIDVQALLLSTQSVRETGSPRLRRFRRCHGTGSWAVDQKASRPAVAGSPRPSWGAPSQQNARPSDGNDHPLRHRR